MEGTRSPYGCPGGNELRSGSEPSLSCDARYRALISAAGVAEGRAEELSGCELEPSLWKSGVPPICLCWLYICLHRHHASAASMTATLASAVTTMPQTGIPVADAVWLLALVGKGV